MAALIVMVSGAAAIIVPPTLIRSIVVMLGAFGTLKLGTRKRRALNGTL